MQQNRQQRGNRHNAEHDLQCLIKLNGRMLKVSKMFALFLRETVAEIGGYLPAVYGRGQKRKMLTRTQKLEEGKVSGGKGWRIEGRRTRITRKESQRLKQ